MRLCVRETELTSSSRCLGSGCPDCEFEHNPSDRSSGGLERLYTAAGRSMFCRTRSDSCRSLGTRDAQGRHTQPCLEERTTC